MTAYIKNSTKFILFILLLINLNSVSAQSNNNSYVFDLQSSYAGILDDEDLASNAVKSAYQYFDEPTTPNTEISIEAWVYLIGENLGEKMPIIYRSVGDNYETFSLYIKDRVAYFSIGDGQGEVSTVNQTLIRALDGFI